VIYLYRLTCFLGAFICAQTLWAQSAPFETEAPHAVILDYNSGLVLFEKNARNPIAPASMTKIMTADIVFEQIKSGKLSLTDNFRVSEDAWRRGGVKSGSSTMFLDVNSDVSVQDLLRGVIIQSGNDACIVLAQGIAGTETAFARMMTRRAKALGLDSANFENATGWPHPDHKISTYDWRVWRVTLSKAILNFIPFMQSVHLNGMVFRKAIVIRYLAQ